ncbi:MULTISPECIES: hypothetical protein [unclassified Flavobacterium]|uniref:hypothetical protein n=1 Tax=unclassified Flavobacterium TaxID=196869 RepID=UPI002633F471|nr:hypothetical protein [Flavobacterium sp.]
MNALLQKKWMIIFLLFSYISLFAEALSPNDPPGDEDPDPTKVPIDQYTLLLIIVAITLAFFLIRKQYRKTNNA